MKTLQKTFSIIGLSLILSSIHLYSSIAQRVIELSESNPPSHNSLRGSAPVQVPKYVQDQKNSYASDIIPDRIVPAQDNTGQYLNFQSPVRPEYLDIYHDRSYREERPMLTPDEYLARKLELGHRKETPMFRFALKIIKYEQQLVNGEITPKEYAKIVKKKRDVYLSKLTTKDEIQSADQTINEFMQLSLVDKKATVGTKEKMGTMQRYENDEL
jgi:hypothetical protein